LHSWDEEFAPVGLNTQIHYGQRFNKIKKFLMHNSHRERIKFLFRWWNRAVFTFETPGTRGKEDDELIGMEEAEAALNLDEEFSDADNWYAREDFLDNQPALQMHTNNDPDDLSTSFMQLTISEHSVSPPVPLPAPAHAIAAPQVREPSLVHSIGVSSHTIS
jgi:hypothetical protein